MTGVLLDIERLAAALRGVREIDNLTVAQELAASGGTVVVLAPRSKAPLLTDEHIARCGECRRRGLRAMPHQGMTSDPSLIEHYFEVHADAGVAMQSHPRLLRGDMDCLDGPTLKRTRKLIGYGTTEPLPFGCPTPGGPHRRRVIHLQPEGELLGGGGTVAVGTSWYGSSGYVMVAGIHDKTGIDYFPFYGDEITPTPESVRKALTARGSVADPDNPVDHAAAANAATVATFLEEHVGRNRMRLVAEREGAVARSKPGERHHVAATQLVLGFRDAIAGYVPAADVVTAVTAGLRKAKWEKARFDKELGSITAWAVGQVDGLTTDEARSEIDARYRKAAARADEDRIPADDDGARDLTEDELDTIEAQQGGPSTRRRRAARNDPPLGIDPDTGEILRLHLPDELYNARPALAHISQAARARQRARDAVLHVVLARVAAAVQHFIKLPATVGSPSPLCYFAVTLAPPGYGKGDAGAIGTELVPVDDYVADQLPIGSGEGLAEVLFDLVTEEDNGKPVKVKRLVRHNAFVIIDEGDALTQLGTRSGSTLLSTTRSIWSGKVIGNTNAARENRRIVPPGAYTFGIVVGLQDTKAGPLLDEVDAGTPQRFGWAYAIDPNLPDSPPAWPGPLNWQPPDEKLLGTIYTHKPPDEGPTHPLDVAPEIKAEIRAVDLARAKGEGPRDPWAAHGALVRLRIAALLAILDGRLHVKVDDWELAGMVKAISDNVRAHAQNAVIAEAAQKEKQTSTRLANRAAEADVAVRQRRVIHCAEKISDKVHAQPEGWTVSSLRRSLRSWLEVFDDGFAHAKVEGWVVERAERGQGADKRTVAPGAQRVRRAA